MKLTLSQFQMIDNYMSQDISDLDKSFFSVCVVYDLSPLELDEMDVRKVYKMITRVNKILSNRRYKKIFKRVGMYEINYEPDKLTFGQFIALSYYVSNGYMQYAHNIFSVLSGDNDNTRQPFFLNAPADRLIGGLKLFLENFRQFINQYKPLFGVGTENAEEIEADPFQKRYGWTYSATLVKAHTGLTLEETENLPVREAFGHLGYLKEKARYDEKQLNRK